MSLWIFEIRVFKKEQNDYAGTSSMTIITAVTIEYCQYSSRSQIPQQSIWKRKKGPIICLATQN